MPGISDAKKRANKKWNDANMNEKYDHIHLVTPKGNKDIIKANADKKGISVNGYINEAIDEKIERESN